MSNFDLGWTGMAYPFRIENGSVGKSTSIIGSKEGLSDHVNQSIELIVKTTTGEWFTRDYIGNKFRKCAFDNFSDELDSYIKFFLTNAIQEQDPRVSISSIDITRDKENSCLTVSIKWDYNKDVIQSNDDNIYEVDVNLDI